MNLGYDIRLILLIFITEILTSFSFKMLYSSSARRSIEYLEYFKLYAKSGTKKKKVYDGTIAVNRSARFNYEILDTYEAGISLLGISC